MTVSRDKIDHIVGVRQQSLALDYELLLSQNPAWVEQVVLGAIAMSMDGDREVEHAVSGIVMHFGIDYSTLAQQQLVLLTQHIGRLQAMALMSSRMSPC